MYVRPVELIIPISQPLYEHGEPKKGTDTMFPVTLTFDDIVIRASGKTKQESRHNAARVSATLKICYCLTIQIYILYIIIIYISDQHFKIEHLDKRPVFYKTSWPLSVLCTLSSHPSKCASHPIKHCN